MCRPGVPHIPRGHIFGRSPAIRLQHVAQHRKSNPGRMLSATGVCGKKRPPQFRHEHAARPLYPHRSMLQHARKMGFAKAGVYFAHPTRIRRHHRFNIDGGGVGGIATRVCRGGRLFRTHRNRKNVVLQCLCRSTQWRWTRLCLQFAALGF